MGTASVRRGLRASGQTHTRLAPTANAAPEFAAPEQPNPKPCRTPPAWRRSCRSGSQWCCGRAATSQWSANRGPSKAPWRRALRAHSAADTLPFPRGFVAAEQVCCASIGWQMDEEASILRVTANEAPLDQFGLVFQEVARIFAQCTDENAPVSALRNDAPTDSSLASLTCVRTWRRRQNEWRSTGVRSPWNSSGHRSTHRTSR